MSPSTTTLRLRRRPGSPHEVVQPAPAGAAAPRCANRRLDADRTAASSPPLDAKWLAIDEHRSPRHTELAASGLRLTSTPRSPARSRPGLRSGCGRRRAWPRPVGRVASPPGRSTNASPRSVRNRKPTRMLPPGCAAVLAVDRVDLAVLVGRAAGRRDRGDQPRRGSGRRRRRRCSSAPLLSWISSTATMSGARSLFTISVRQRVVLRLRVVRVEVLDVER